MVQTNPDQTAVAGPGAAPESSAPQTPSLDDLLRRLNELQASDLHLKPMRPPMVRLNGNLMPIGPAPLPPDVIESLLLPVIPEQLRPRLGQELAVEFGHGVAGVSRFRASIFYQRGTLAGVFRRVSFNISTLEDWGLPDVMARFCDPPQGLVLITGPTGSGKSSTLAALMRRIAESRAHHIVTIEDPIEFLICDGIAAVSQREVGTDTPSFSIALRNALRQDPDVMMVGEMRDEETMRTVLTAAETGHLVFSTLHTNSAGQTVDRIVGSFSKGNHDHVRQQLAVVLEAVASLQLVPRADGSGMVAAVEIMRRTPQITKLIQRGDFEALREEIENSVAYHKMQSMNQSLVALVINGTITRETALAASANPSDLDLILRKTVGTTLAADEGDSMAESMSDFSKIQELQEVKRLYDDLQDTHRRELESRDLTIAELNEQLAGAATTNQQQDRSAQLQLENQSLTAQLKQCRNEYEVKIERLNARVRDLSAKAAQPVAEPEKKSFFRR